MEISFKELNHLYVEGGLSASQIACVLNCSNNKVNYWLEKHGIKKRSISEAVYRLKNPSGDPFLIKEPRNQDDSLLLGLGLGLYWGEGLKRGRGGMRLTNTDPHLVRKFMEFLERMCGVEKSRLRFSVQVFEDLNPEIALRYWANELSVGLDQFYKPVVSRVRGPGTYRNKSQHGVVIVYFNNVRLKEKMCEMIDKIR